MNKQRKDRKKKAELTTQQLVMIIVLILSFAVLLFFIFRLNLGGTTNKEICHDSVVKESSPVLGLTGELNCKTEYVCISGGGKCNQITASSTVNVDANNKDEIFRAIAEEMANCWWMFGEGKLNYGKGCAICSYIGFDEKIESIYSEGISYKEFLDSLTMPVNVQKSNENYLYYLYGVNNLNSLFALERYSSWQTNYFEDTKILLQRKFILLTTGKTDNYLAPEFPFTQEQISSLGCNNNFVTKG